MTSGWSDPAFEPIARLVTAQTGLVFAPNRCPALEQGVRQLMKEHALSELSEVPAELESGALSWDKLIALITVGETYFFRDAAHFEFLKDRVLPEIAARRGPNARARVWSAGCASGEEAYSLAMALADCNALEGAFVLGTDLNRAALSRARLGRYKRWSLRGLAPALFERYFSGTEADSVLSPLLLRQVHFEELNLAREHYPQPATGTFAMDLILCRNVLIYLSPAAIARVARGLFDALTPGGYLLFGPSDPLLLDAGFEIESDETGVVYRRPHSILAAVADVRVSPVLPFAPRVDAVAVPLQATRLEPEALREVAEQAAARGDDAALLALANQYPDQAWLSVMAIRARSNAAPPRSVEQDCRRLLDRHPLSAELHYLHALAQMQLSRPGAAAEALRRALYLDRTLAIAHFTLGSVLARLNDLAGAERSYRNAANCSLSLPEHEPLPCAREITAFGLASAAARELELLRGRGAAR